MGDEKKNYKVGEKVEATAEYVCELCNTEGGVHVHEFKEGEEFPVCGVCGNAASSWKKAPKKD